MTDPTQPKLDGPDPVADSLKVTSSDVGDASPPLDLGYVGRGHGCVEPTEPRLLTFNEMLPAARAFYRSHHRN